MNASAHIVDIDESNAQQLLIEESMNRPVVVDFWADWCEPCKQLIPILEKLAAEYQGTFLLAKVNADEQQMLAQQLELLPRDVNVMTFLFYFCTLWNSGI